MMAKMGLTPIYQRPRTSDPHPQHRVYPYLLRKLAIERPNHVWCIDVTYIPMRRGFLYLVAIMDWASRKVLAWRLSNTLDAGFCAAALEEALARYGRPEIVNTDQGSGVLAELRRRPDLVVSHAQLLRAVWSPRGRIGSIISASRCAACGRSWKRMQAGPA